MIVELEAERDPNSMWGRFCYGSAELSKSDQETLYHNIKEELSTLSEIDLLQGCKTFEEYNIAQFLACPACFVGHIFGHAAAKHYNRNMPLHYTYFGHYYYPEIVFLVASELL